MGTTFYPLLGNSKNIGRNVRANADLENLTKSITNSTLNKKSSTDVYKPEQSANVRSVIQLHKPTFNYVLGRAGCSLLRKILGVPKDIWDDIVSFRKIWDVENAEFIDPETAPQGREYLYGPEIAIDMVDNFDVEQATIDALYEGFYSFLSTTKVEFLRDVVSIDKTPGDMPLAGGYHAHFDTAAMINLLKRNRNLDMLKEGYAKVLLRNQDSRFTYLRNLRTKQDLYQFFNYFIVVIPYDMRPTMDKRKHKLTKHYVDILNASKDLEGTNRKGSCGQYSDRYRTLDQQVSHFQYKNVDLKLKSIKKDDRSILERMKGKKGQIRKHNYGKRQDYSGRAVVCINPYLPLDVIRVPKTMLPKLLEYHLLPYLSENLRSNAKDKSAGHHTENIYDILKLTDLKSPAVQNELYDLIEKHKLLDKVPMVLGRQPTLHKQGVQGFHIEVTDFHAIEVNPLVCPAFNMDFDGDQAHLEVPISPGAIEDVKNLILTTQNLFLPKTGECTTEPRQDMLYGLWLCTKDEYELGKAVKAYDTYTDVRNDLLKHRLRVYDTVYCGEAGSNIIAGNAAFIACFPKGDVVPRGKGSSGSMEVMCVTKKTITKYMDHLMRVSSDGYFVHNIGSKRASVETCTGCINALVELGFKIARQYPPNMSLVHQRKSIPEYDNAVKDFYDSMKEADLYYNLGMETTDNYTLEFAERIDHLNNVKEKYIIDKLGEDNGYVKLAVSGARGNVSNLLQAFALKGKVKKNDTESFDALLENSYASQLTPMEGFVAAYGGRQGQIDKSLKTGDTGYASRKMWHATQGMSIVAQDCGTKEGIAISKKDLIIFSSKESDADKLADVKQIFKHAITGRFHAENGLLISDIEAERLANDDTVDSVIIRSPIKCKNPCCVKCYGRDWSTRRIVVPGTSVGVLAAHSIGEPATQLTMKTFQKGGVASQTDVTSAFDKVDVYVHMQDLADMSKKGKYSGYDPLAWTSGPIKVTPTSEYNQVKVTIGDSKQSVIVPAGLKMKSEAVKGEGLSYIHGDYDINEIINISGLEAAQKYLAFKLYATYRSEVNIKTIHFEVLVACMTRYMIVDTDRSDLLVGQYATSKELHAGSIEHTTFFPKLIGVKQLPFASHEALDSIVMESIGKGLSRITLLHMKDSLTKPLNRILLGLTIKEGSAYKGYVDAHKETI